VALKVSAATVSRWLAAGLLKPAAHRGRQPLYRLADGRAAQKRAASTPEVKATVSWLHAQAVEARAHVYRLHAEWVHRADWEPDWRVLVASVLAVLRDWTETGAPALRRVVHEPRTVLTGPWGGLATGSRAIGYAAQAWTGEILTRLAALPPPRSWASAPPRPAPVPRPASITAAKGALVAARTAWAELRTRIKTEPGWRKRPELEAACLDAVAHARDALWNGVPARMVALHEPDEATVRAELDQVVADVARALAAPLSTPEGRSRHA
jgi:hypothetical protein